MLHLGDVFTLQPRGPWPPMHAMARCERLQKLKVRQAQPLEK